MGSGEVSGTSSRVDALFDNVLKALEERLEDEEERAKLPGTGLLNLGLLLLKQREPEKTEDDQEDIDVLDMVEKTDLPDDRKQELIQKERQRLLDRLTALDEVEVPDE